MKNICQDVTIHAVAEGSVVFPRVPLMRVTGPLIVVQLLETTFLTLVTRIHGADSNCQEAARYYGFVLQDKRKLPQL